MKQDSYKKELTLDKTTQLNYYYKMTDTYYDSAQGIVLYHKKKPLAYLLNMVVKNLMNSFKTWATKKSMKHRKSWNG